MTADRIVTASELPLLFEMTAARMGQFSIGFVKILGNEDDAVIAGAGTLVTAGRRFGILTADHVLAGLPKQGSVGLVFPDAGPPRLHRQLVQIDATDKVTIGPASYDSSGPDLGLLILAEHDAANLKARRTLYNLATRRDEMLSRPRSIQDGGWFLMGMVHEQTEDLPPERGFTRVKGFHGHCGAGVVSAERTTGEYDYLDFEAKYGAGYEGPQSFQGYSGGGLWQMVYTEREGRFEIKDALLSGVAFYESALVGDLRTIYCHGRRSIYDHALAALSRIA